MLDNNGFWSVRWPFGEMCAEPYLFIFLNTFKYVSAHGNNNPDKCFNILKKEEYEYSTFPNKVRHPQSTAS